MSQERDELRQRINTHFLLSVPVEQRPRYTRQRLELTELLLEYKGFAALLQRDLANAEAGAEQAFWGYYQKRATRTMAFDGLAFAQAAQTAIYRYSGERGASFLTYFDTVYERQLRGAAQEKSREEQRLGLAVPARKNKLIRDLSRLLEQKYHGAPPNRLPEDLCAHLAAVLDITADEVARLWDLARAVRCEPLPLDSPLQEGSDYTLAEAAADPDGADPQEKLERSAWVSELLEAFADLDKREYPRLFLTNDILRPLKQPDDRTDAAAYGRLLVRYEEALFAHVFWPGYLLFVLEQPPAPDSLRGIILAHLCRPLQSQTIAAYKNVSKAAVSQQQAAYRRLLETYRKAH